MSKEKKRSNLGLHESWVTRVGSNFTEEPPLFNLSTDPCLKKPTQTNQKQTKGQILHAFANREREREKGGKRVCGIIVITWPWRLGPNRAIELMKQRSRNRGNRGRAKPNGEKPWWEVFRWRISDWLCCNWKRKRECVWENGVGDLCFKILVCRFWQWWRRFNETPTGFERCLFLMCA